MDVNQTQSALTALLSSGRAKFVLRWTRRLFLGVMLLFLGFKLTQLGWEKIWHALPTSPLFYLIFLVAYFVLPLAETLIYRRSWKFDFWQGAAVFLKKQVYNQEVLDYSGEMYLYVWARQKVDYSDSQILKTIKDNSIVSAICGYLVALTLPAICLSCGQLAPMRQFAGHEHAWIAAMSAAAVLLLTGALFLRKVIFSLPWSTVRATFVIHMTRILAYNTMLFAQWALMMPQEPYYVWFTLLTVQNIVGRLPSLPGKDLIFVAAGIGASQGMEAPSAAIAGMLLMGSVLEKSVNVVLFPLVTLCVRRAEKRAAREPQPAILVPAPHLAPHARHNLPQATTVSASL
jgi:hypothetical protein